MSLKILEVNPDDFNDDEYVKIKVIENCNLGEYAVTDETFDKKGKESDIFRHAYFFPKKDVNKNEIIYLYTSKGDYRSTEEGTIPTHIFHWGSDESIWNNEGDTATIIKYTKIDTFAYKKSTGSKKNLLLKNILEDM